MNIVITQHDEETEHVFDGISEIHKKSSELAKNAIARRFQILMNVYAQNECKTFTHLCEIIDTSDLSYDLNTFQLVYLQRSFKDKDGEFFGWEDWNVVLGQDYDDLAAQKIKVLQVTGWRGSGKTTISRHHIARQLAYARRNNIGIVASDKERAERIVRTILDFFVRTETINGTKRLTAFGERFADLLIPTAGLLREEEKRALEHRFRAMSIAEGFSLANGVRIFPIAPVVGARGEATYEERFDEGYGDDLEEKDSALSAKTKKTMNIIDSMLNAYTGDPKHTLIFSLCGNRNNPEPESIFNQIIKRSGKDESYRVRSISVLKEDGSSNTIRMTDEEAQAFAKTAGADGTDSPYDNIQNPIMDTANFSYTHLGELQQGNSFRCAFVDLAFTKKNDSSDTGVIVLYITPDGKLHFGSQTFKAVGRNLIGRLVRIADDHKLNSLTVERMITADVMPDWIRDEMDKHGLTGTIVNDVMAPRDLKKEERIGKALPLFDPTSMGFISEMRNPLVEEMRTFTPEKLKRERNKYDSLDAFAYAVEWFTNNKSNLAFMPFKQQKEEPQMQLDYMGISV